MKILSYDDFVCFSLKSIRINILIRFIGLLMLGTFFGCAPDSSTPYTREIVSNSTGASSDSYGSGYSSSGTESYKPGVFLPSENFSAKCVTPRSGVNPSTGYAYPDVAGSRIDENNWLRSWSNELYLWYNEINDVDPAIYLTEKYFELMKTFSITPSGNPKDRFHFSIPTDEWYSLSQSGVTAGYGLEWAIISATPPRQVVIAYTHPDSPATSLDANLARGAEILEVDGVDLVNTINNAEIDTLNAGLFPDGVGETHTFKVRDLGSSTTRIVTLQSTYITMAPVQNVTVIPTSTGNVGYMLFLDHIATAEDALIKGINQLQASGITDLVLDLRYNGGGYLVIASELAYMIAGAASTAGQTFEEIRFNDKHPTTDPVTGEELLPLPFQATSVGLSAPIDQALPTLDLNRVFVLTGPDTCSASEAIINALEGIDIEVIQIGSTTCGKPYGFYPSDNCGTTYFSIQFKGVNAKGFGDYADGFSPDNTIGAASELVPGCSVADDFTHALGDPNERRLATALSYRNGSGCPEPSGFALSPSIKSTTARSLAAVNGRLKKSPWLNNRILLKPNAHR